jgi:hypothetical protein
MNKKFYPLRARFLVLVTGLLFSTSSTYAQYCGGIDLGADKTICTSESVTLTPTVNFVTSGELDSVLAYKGNVSYVDRALGDPDGRGAYFCRGNSGKYTGAVWKLPCYIPSGTKLTVRIKVPCGSAYLKIYGAKDDYAYSSDYTWIATKYKSGSYYHNFTVTTNGEYNIIKILDMGCKAFYIDAITYDISCTPTYAWSNGSTTKSITVSPTTSKTYSVTASCGGFSYTDSVDVNVSSCNSVVCTKQVSNTVGCANTPYVIWLKDKNGKGHHLKGDTTKYVWHEYDNGDVRFTADDISASGLSGTFDVDLLFSGRTSTAPVNSPKLSNCFTVSSSSDWEYFTTTSGTITSTNYGTITVSRKGPAFQMGDGANIIQDGYGASGWFDVSGGNGHITTGDVNVMLSDCIDSTPTLVVCAYDSLDFCFENEFDLADTFNVSKVYMKEVSKHTGNGYYRIKKSCYGCTYSFKYVPDVSFEGKDTIELEVYYYVNRVKVTKWFTLIIETKDCGIVPVEWLSFTARKSGDDAVVVLDWSTATEINNSHFEVQRSVSGEAFKPLGDHIKGAGNSVEVNSYGVLDLNPVKGLVHYRIKQIDFDGKFDYSPIQTVMIGGRSTLTIFPNPAGTQVNIHFESGRNSEVVIKNLSGQVMDTTWLSEEGNAQLDTENYPQGIYFLTVNGETRRLVIQH